MIKWILILVSFVILSPKLQASQTCENRGPNVIVVTFDGVRRMEFFGKPSIFRNVPDELDGKILEKFWNKYAKQGIVYGSRGLFHKFSIDAPLALSLPSYQTIYLGRRSGCTENDCGRIREETFFDRIWKELNLSYTEVASVASWLNMDYAVKSPKGDFFVHAGPNPEHRLQDDYIDWVQANSIQDLPTLWGSSKFDKYTADMALYYLNQYCPRLFNIAFVDTDEWGHQNNYTEYVRSLKSYDDFLDKLFTNLDNLGEYGKNTTVFVTTDHGRGIGPFFPKHAVTKFTEKSTFLYVRGPTTPKVGWYKKGKKRTTAHIRPTVERIFGLSVDKKLPYLKEVIGN